jgi:hypothetical protein
MSKKTTFFVPLNSAVEVDLEAQFIRGVMDKALNWPSFEHVDDIATGEYDDDVTPTHAVRYTLEVIKL